MLKFFLGIDELKKKKKNERNFISNQNGTDKPKSKILIDFYQSLSCPTPGIRGVVCILRIDRRVFLLEKVC